jgi:hypothetical protein
MSQLNSSSSRIASIRLARVVSHLQRAGQQLRAATHTAPTRYQQQQLRRLAVDLRALSAPIEGLASFLEHGGGR